MAKLFFSPMGTSIDSGAVSVAKNGDVIDALEAKLTEKRSLVKNGWGQVYQDRVQAKGKLTAHARVNALADNARDILFINTFVNDGRAFGDEANKKSAPNAGVLTAFVRIHDRWVIVIANDNTVASGSWWPRRRQKK